MKATCNNFLIILPDPAPTETQGGIALPETAKERPTSGVIVLGIKDYYDEGRRVWYHSYNADNIKLKLDNLKEIEYHAVKCEEVIGIE